MSLKTLAKSLRQGEVLLPRLRRFLVRENDKRREGLLKRRDVVAEDAKMTIRTFRERLEEYDHEEDLDGEFFHPSQLGACQRALWYGHHHAPKDAAQSSEDLLRELMIFETGTYVGVVFQNLCKRAGFLTRREVAIVDRKNRILGHADGELLIDDIFYILEIKTINGRGFTQLGNKAKKAHIQQAHAYMKSLKHKWAIIVYLEKDRHGLKEFVIPFSAKFYQEEVAARIDSHFKNLQSKKPPVREGENPRLFPCAYCPYTRVCFGTAEGKKFLRTL